MKTHHIPHSVTTPIACKKFGGKWDTSYGFSRGVCVMNERCTKDGCVGWTAPVHGIYFIWGADKIDAHELYEDPKAEGIEGGHIAEAFASGCIAKDNPNYPDDPSPCRTAIPLCPMDWYFEHEPNYKELAEHAKGYALSYALDFYNKPDSRKIEYYDKKGRRLPGYHKEGIPVDPSSGYGDGEAPLKPEYPGFKIRRQR